VNLDAMLASDSYLDNVPWTGEPVTVRRLSLTSPPRWKARFLCAICVADICALTRSGRQDNFLQRLE
jgi:hypothetical protein